MAQWYRNTCNAGNTGDSGVIPGLGRSPGGGHGKRFQYSCWEYPMDRESWQATVHAVAELDTIEVTEHAHTCGDIWQCLETFLGSTAEELLLVSSAYRPWLLINIVQCSGQPHIANNYLASNVISATTSCMILSKYIKLSVPLIFSYVK